MVRTFTPSLTSLRAFEAYARTGRLVDAAAELRVTHGAISRQIKQLEEQIGVRLLTGHPGKVVLTEQAKLYARELTRTFDEIEAASAALRQADEARLQILCPGSFAMRWLIPRLRDFSERHPQVSLDLVDSSGPWAPSTDGPHGAIRVADYEGTTQARALPFMRRRFGPVVSPTLCGNGAMDLAALLAMPRLHVSSIPTDWEDWAREYGMPLPQNARELSYGRSFHLLEAAQSGLGASIADLIYVAAEIEAGRLIAPLGFVPSPRADVFLRAPDCRSKAADLFERWLIDIGGADG